MKIKRFDILPSTHTYLKEHPEEEMMAMIIADAQPGGRGQRGNSWESAPGKNLTFSMHYRPEGVHPREQFAISEAVALAVVDLLRHYEITAMVKWPNDIYVGDRKICGILIEHSVSSEGISRTIAGAGINVNQEEFLSDAPNPVSMTQLTGKSYDLTDVAEEMGLALERRLPQASDPEGRRALHVEFMEDLWRGDGKMYPFRIEADAIETEAKIAAVAPNGIITLEFPDGSRRDFAFKEISFLLK